MKVLTIKQPWAGLLAVGVKDIENRDKRTDYRGWVALHAGLSGDPGAFGDSRVYDALDQVPHSVSLARGYILAVGWLDDIRQDWDSPWYDGPLVNGKKNYGWKFTKVRRLTRPVLHRGSLGLTELAAETTAKVEAQL